MRLWTGRKCSSSPRLGGEEALADAVGESSPPPTIETAGPVITEAADDTAGESALDESEVFVPEDRPEFTEEEAVGAVIYAQAYRDVRRSMQERKKARGFLPRRSEQAEARSGGSGGTDRERSRSRRPEKTTSHTPRPRLGREELRLRTRCWTCNELGHTSRDCPKKAVSASSGTTTKGAGKSSFFAFFGGALAPERPPTSAGLSMDLDNLLELSATGETLGNSCYPVFLPTTFVGIVTSATEGVVDTAAEDGCCGSLALAEIDKALRKKGLKVAWRPTAGSQPCSGIGGRAEPLGQADIPVGILGVNGVIRVNVIKDTPDFRIPLLFAGQPYGN